MVHFVNKTPFDFKDEQRFSPVYQTTLNQRSLFLPGGGCKFWLQTKGKGCPFCGFPGLTRLVVLGDDAEANYEGWLLDTDVFTQMYDLAATDHVDKFTIYNGGSFFVDSEVPAAARQHMLTDLSERRDLRQIMVESRPEYLNRDILSEAKTMAGDKDLMIGIGLESANTMVRNKVLRKGMSLGMFESAYDMMRKAGVQVFVYVFLGAPGLSEQAAIDDAIATLDYLHALGVDEIALSCAFVPPGSHLAEDYAKGRFRTPWLWSVDQVVGYAHQNRMPLSLGGFDDNPTPIAIAHNCDTCSAGVLEVFDRYRRTGILGDQKPCGCIAEWTQLTQGARPIAV